MQGDPYQVALSYCDGVVMMHDHEDVREAVLDYADALQEAFEPTVDEHDRRHVRQVTLMKFNKEGAIVRHIDSGVMNDDCSHRRTDHRKIDTKGTL
jgi:hypothetical protein